MEDICLTANTMSTARRKLKDLERWASAHHVRFDPRKTKVFFAFSTEGADADLHLQGFPLETTDTYKYLGITLGKLGPRGFSLDTHMKQEYAEIRKLLKLLRQAIKGCSLDMSRRLYLAMVRSKMDYCLILKKEATCMRARSAIIGLNNCLEHILQEEFDDEVYHYSPASWLTYYSALHEHDDEHLSPLEFPSDRACRMSFLLIGNVPILGFDKENDL